MTWQAGSLPYETSAIKSTSSGASFPMLDPVQFNFPLENPCDGHVEAVKKSKARATCCAAANASGTSPCGFLVTAFDFFTASEHYTRVETSSRSR